MASKGGRVCGMNTPNKGVILDSLYKAMILIPGRTELDGTRFCHITQNYTQFRTYELFISVVFHLIFWTSVTETTENETEDKEILFYND